MKMFLISDNVDTQTGMRLAGVEGVVVHEREELYDTLQKTLAAFCMRCGAAMPEKEEEPEDAEFVHVEPEEKAEETEAAAPEEEPEKEAEVPEEE